MQSGALFQQLRQLLGLSRDLTVGLDKFIPLGAVLGDPFGAPKGCGTQQKARNTLSAGGRECSFSCSSS